MLNYNEIIPVNLIQKPVEQAVIAIWLVAIGQFINFAYVSSGNITVEWFLTAPALMLASMIVAVKTQKTVPFIIAFLIGLSAVLILLLADLFSNNILKQTLSYYFDHALIIASLYGLVFWLLFSRFLNSHYFLSLKKYIASDNDLYELLIPLEKVSFYLSFLIINISLITSIALVFLYPSDESFILFIIVIGFLFVSEKFISANLRGVLLPVYMTLFLIAYFNSPNSSVKIDADITHQVLFLCSFALWVFHNSISTVYNRIFSNKKIITGLWPWYGLLLVLFTTFYQASGEGINVSSLVILMVYLFLMLRNTSSPLISWFVIILFFRLFIMLQSPENLIDSPHILLLEYGKEFLFFSLFLLVFSIVWDRYINKIVIYAGWKTNSFRKPVLVITFFIGLLYLVLNTYISFALIAESYDLMNISFKIENTSALVLVLFFSLSLFINNKVVVNLIYFSTLVLLVVSWGDDKLFPVYLLFSLFTLTLILLALVNNYFNKNSFYWNDFFNESTLWVNIGFAVSILSIFSVLAMSDFDFGTSWLFFNTAILFICSLVLSKYQKSNLWYAVSYMLAAALIVLLRLMIMGTVAVNEVDTIGILLISFFFYAVSHVSLFSSTRIDARRLAIVLPLSSLFTIPWSTGSVHSSLTLIVLGIFYFIIQNHSSEINAANKNSRFIQYKAFIFINMAVYLWIPMLSDYTCLLLFYVIPVVFSLLFIIHLHKNEIKPELQNKARLLALSSFYVVVTTDVFISDTLFVFVLGLLSGFASIIYGISSKIRLFLYTGVGFMIVIILGQLMLFYPEGRLARALILMVFGATITGSMIWFNIKREMLLSRIRLFRSDLDTWD